MRLRRRAPLLGLLLTLLAPAAAGATVARVDYFEIDERIDVHTDYVVRVVGARGERNDVVLGIDGRGRILVTERGRGARLRAGRDCRKLSRRRARCSPRRPLDRVRVVLGGGDDRARVFPGAWTEDVPVEVVGGDGRDRLTSSADGLLDGGAGRDVLRGRAGGQLVAGGRGDDRLSGGPGDDQLDGDGGRDRLEGGPGDDTLGAADGRRTARRDVLDGGRGSDTVSYGRRLSPVRVRLQRPVRAGRRGREDVLRSIENATGGAGDDRLTGDDGPNALDGGSGGDDVLTGLGGPDVLRAEGGVNRISGGPGDDRLHGSLGAGRMSCGPGGDEAETTSAQLLSADCEVAGGTLSGRQLAHPVAVTPDTLVFRVGCDTADVCRHVLRVSRPPRRAPWRDRTATPGQVLASAEVAPLARGASRDVVVPRAGALATPGLAVAVEIVPSWVPGPAGDGWGILISG